MILKTKRLILRPWRESDAECLYHFAKNPNVGPIAGWPPHKNIEESLNTIRTIFNKKETYAITINERAIGCVSLIFYPDTNHYWPDKGVELGYWIGEEYWGQGLVAEASKELIEHGFNDLNIKKIYASFQVENNQSKRVLEKLGFKYYSNLKGTNHLKEEIEEIAMILERN